jgi:hypothetical protein
MTRVAPAQEVIERRIFLVHGHKVMLDRDLAQLYGVPTKVLVQAVKRNRIRFPLDFMFQLTRQDLANLKSQIVTSSAVDGAGWGGRRKPLNAFTEQAWRCSLPCFAVRGRLRQTSRSCGRSSTCVTSRRVSGHDQALSDIIQAIRDLAAPPAMKPKRRIGFVTQD